MFVSICRVRAFIGYRMILQSFPVIPSTFHQWRSPPKTHHFFRVDLVAPSMSRWDSSNFHGPTPWAHLIDGSDEDELQHGQLGQVSLHVCIGYRHQDIYIYTHTICIYWVPSPISGKPSISHLPTQAKVRWATVGPWFAGQTWRVIHGFYPGIATPLKFPEV